MLKVNNFLGCMDLETGGFVIGGVFLFLHSIFSLVIFVLALALTIVDCKELVKLIDKSKSHNDFEGFELDRETIKQLEEIEDPEKVCSFGVGFIAVICVVVLLFMIGFIVIDVFCLRGTKRRDHIQVRPMMIVMAVFSIYYYLHIFTLTVPGIVDALVWGTVYGYFFVVLYSIFVKFRTERESGHVYNAQYQAAASAPGTVPDMYVVPMNQEIPAKPGMYVAPGAQMGPGTYPPTQGMYPTMQTSYPMAQGPYPMAPGSYATGPGTQMEKQPMYQPNVNTEKPPPC